jgi:uncharacterized protein (TIGR03067 family)
MIYPDIRSCFAVAFLLLVVPACTGRSSEPPKAADLTGDYRIVSGERNGAPIDQNELSDTTIHISAQTITAYDKDRKETFVATYTLETNRIPWQITMISTKAPETGVVSKGLIQAEQNQVKLVYALPNGQPPTEFKAGERQQMFVLAKTDAAPRTNAPAGT